MNTSFLTAVLAGALLAGQGATPAWNSNYGQAQQQSAAQKKPLAVVFGSGANGWTKVVRGDSPSADVSRLLADKYICVYVDVSTPAGAKLAQQFEIKNGVGIVLSDRSASTQAFWHQGDLPSDSLAGYLTKYADPQVVVRGTETTSTRSSFYPSSDGMGGFGNLSGSSYCPSCNNVRGRR